MVLSGSPVLVIDGERIPAPTGTLARLDPEPKRTVVNEGDEVASVLTCRPRARAATSRWGGRDCRPAAPPPRP